MCGICGILYTDRDRPVDRSRLQRMTDVIAHRGPDDEGHFADRNVGLGSRRLSILGLGDGHMPMASEDERLWVVYNGEMYNHPEIKARLSGKGYTYRTGSDTESFLHLYREYGETFLEHTQGMFGVALWDSANQTLILGRDRLGIKPLYYHFDGKALRFASEIKSILCDPDVPRAIDPNALNLFCSYLATPAPYSMFQGIRQLLPGGMLIYRDGKIELRSFWQPSETIRPIQITNAADAANELRERFDAIVKEHLLSDVPVGAFLSGGIDSSVLVALMHKHLGSGFHTFSIGFEGHALFDETPHARLVAERFGTNHYERMLQPNDLLAAMDDITWQLDEPLADSSCLPVYYVSQLAAEHGKVVLSGDGGDEIFAGYRKYLGEHFRKYLSWLPDAAVQPAARWFERHVPESRAGYWMDLLRQGKKFFRGLDPNPIERHRKWAIHFEDALRARLLHPDVMQQADFEESYRYREQLFHELPDADELTKMLWVDLRHGLPADMLMKADRMSMLHSLEVRVPFLDHTLVEYAFSLPGELKLRDRTTKWILKEAFKDLLPNEILHRRKHGFDVPVGEWFKGELRDVIEDVCSEKTVKNRGLFQAETVQHVLQQHCAGQRDFNNQLWILLSIELWQRRYCDVPPGTVPARPAAAGSPSPHPAG